MSVLFECSLSSSGSVSISDGNRLLEFVQAINSISYILPNNIGDKCVGNIHMDKNGISFIFNNVYDSIKVDIFVSDTVFNSFKYNSTKKVDNTGNDFTSIYINYSTLLYSLQNISDFHSGSTINNNASISDSAELFIHYSEQIYNASRNNADITALSDSEEGVDNNEAVDLENHVGNNIDNTVNNFNLILQDEFIKELISIKTFIRPANKSLNIGSADPNNIQFDCIIKSKTLLTTLNNLKPFQSHMKNVYLWFKQIVLKPKFKHREFFTGGKSSDQSLRIPNIIFFNKNDEIGNVKISILNDINGKNFVKPKKRKQNKDNGYVANTDNIELLKFNTDGETENEAMILLDFKKLLRIIPILKISDKVLIQGDSNGTLFIQALVGYDDPADLNKERISIEVTIPTKDIEVEENISIDQIKQLIAEYDNAKKPPKRIKPLESDIQAQVTDKVSTKSTMSKSTQSQYKKEKQTKLYF
ncbi:hypothetical protein FOG48_00756 [Hanseniaspora uvarum]|nr:hypothetical protein FOG48_00756 [Hanseniaspora uvarum]